MTSADPARAASRLRRSGPVAALALTVMTGTLVGVWLSLSSVSATPQVPEVGTSGPAHASSPTGAHTNGHVHPDAGHVAMPGLAPEPSPAVADPMAGMSADDMAAHSPEAHAAQDESEESGRPLGVTLAGFGVVNLGVLLIAALVGQRRARQRHRSRPPGRGTPRPAPTTAASPTAANERAGSPS